MSIQERVHAGAELFRQHWPSVAPLIGCDVRRLTTIEDSRDGIARVFDVSAGIDWLAGVSERSRAPVALAARVRASRVSRHSRGTTVRFETVEGHPCEFYRMREALNDPRRLGASVHVNLYVEPEPDVRLVVVAVRVAHLAGWCQAAYAQCGGDRRLMLARHVVRQNRSDGTLFFAPTMRDFERAGVPAVCREWLSAPSLFRDHVCRDVNGGHETMWRGSEVAE